MDSLSKIIKKLSNGVVDLKKSYNEGTSCRRPWRPLFKRNTSPPSNQNPSANQIQLEEFSLQNFCREHNANHCEQTCPSFINMFKIFTSMEDDAENSNNQT